MFKKLVPIFVVLAVAATVTAQTVVDPQTRPATAVDADAVVRRRLGFRVTATWAPEKS